MNKFFMSVMLCVITVLVYGSQCPKKAIVIGASSGMGREISKRLSQQGYIVGLAARRVVLLESLQQELVGPCYIKELDVTALDAREKLEDLIEQMGGVDCIVISISPFLDNQNTLFYDDTEQGWQKKLSILEVCFTGFIAMADVALKYFKEQNSGHLIGISSTSALRGSAYSPEYSAAKAGISCYMEGVRNYMIQNNYNIYVTDVCAGYVAVEHSPYGQDPAAYLEISCEQAGQEIIDAIQSKKKIAYVQSKVWLVALALQWLPDFVYNTYFPWL